MLDVACFGGVTVEDRILDQAQRIVYSTQYQLPLKHVVGGSSPSVSTNDTPIRDLAQW